MKEKLLTLIWLMLLPFVVSKASAKMNGITDIPDSIPIQIEHYQDGMPYCETRMVPYVDNGIPEQNPQVNSQGPKKANTGNTTWTIGSGGNFVDINAAMADDRVVAGDVLELKPGTILTGTQMISKAIHLKGNGYEMDSNGKLANNVAQIQGNLQIRAEGGCVSNLAMEMYQNEAGSYLLPQIIVSSSQAVIEMCYLNGRITGYSNNATIRQCFIKHSISGGSFNGWLIKNNIIASPYGNGYDIVTKLTNATINHNIIFSVFGSNYTQNLLTSISSSTITNNIIVHFPSNNSYTGTYNGTISQDCLTNNTVNHNVFSGSSPNTNNRGEINAIGDIFDYTKYVSALSRVPNYDACFHLVANSPAAGYATDGGDCGPWSGAYPYVVGGTVGEDPNPTFNDGDIFTAPTAEGVEMTFKVISAQNKTCQVGTGSGSSISTSTQGKVTIPSEVKGLTVRNIANRAFKECATLTYISIPSTITAIGNASIENAMGAFHSCSGITAFDIPSSVTFIGRGTFSGCISITHLTIPSSVTSIGSCAFDYCIGLKGIDLSPNIKEIELETFRNCSSLQSIVIPASVASIGYDAFSNCKSLSSVTSKIQNPFTTGSNAFAGIPSDATLYVPAGTESLYRALSDWNRFTNIKPITDGEHDYDWSIGPGADFATVNAAMNDSRVKDGDVLQVLKGANISGNSYITKAVTIVGNGYEDLSDGYVNGVYIDCANVTLKDLYTGYIYVRHNDATIERCRANHITGADGYESEDITIRGCFVLGWIYSNPDDIAWGWNISNNIIISTSYDGNTLDYLAKAAIDHNLIINYKSNFNAVGGDVTESSFTNNILITPSYSVAVNNTAIESAEKFEYNIVSNTGTFANWPTNITGYSDLEKLFVCTGDRMTDAYYKLAAGSPAIGYANDGGDCGPWSGAFPYVLNGKEEVEDNIQFADATVKALCVTNWDTNGDGELSKTEAKAVTSLRDVFKANATIISFNELQFFTGLASIDKAAFQNCNRLTSVTISNSVTNIGDNAFQNCSSLTSVNLPESVINIGYSAFYSCSSMTSITIPNSVTNIRSNTFRYCSSMTSITIPNNVTNIGNNAFEGCSSLTSITIPNSVTNIDYYAFGSCYGLTSVTIPSNVTWLGSNIFVNCSGLTSIRVEEDNAYYDSRDNCNAIIQTNNNSLISGCINTIIPKSVTSIGDYAFYGFNSLKSVNIPDGVTYIGMGAFWNCNLTTITIPESMTTIDKGAFNGCKPTDVYCLAIEVPSAEAAFEKNNIEYATLHVPAQSIENYRATDPEYSWAGFGKIVPIEPEPDPTHWKLDPKLTTDPERYEFATLDALVNYMLNNGYTLKESVTVNVADGTYTMDVIPDLSANSYNDVEEMISTLRAYMDLLMCEVNDLVKSNITISIEAPQMAIFQFYIINSPVFSYIYEFMSSEVQKMLEQGMTQDQVNAKKSEWDAELAALMESCKYIMQKLVSLIKTTNIIIRIDNDIIIDPFQEIEPNDLLALKNIYNMLGGSSWTNKKWKINDYGAKKEDFPGVTFDDEGYVVEINLENNNLRGTINPTGWTWQLCLPRLTGLYLQKNNISGDLSPWLKGVNRNNRLKALNMSYNNLTEISDTIPSSITSLNLENQNREWYRPDGVYTDPLKIEAMSTMTPIRLYLSANQTVVMPSLFTYNHKSQTHSARPTIYIINAEGIDKYGYFKSSGEDTYSLAWKDNEYTEKQNAPCYVRFDNPYGSVYPAYLRYIEGDANMSGYTDVLDVQTTLNYVLNGGGVWQFNRSAANTYEDNLINVQDIVCMVNIVLNNEAVAEGIILNTSSSRRHLRRAADAMDAQGWLYTEKGRVMLTTVNEVGAIDLELKGVSTSQVSLLLNHSQYQMIGRNTEEGSRYVIFSPTGQPIPASEEVALLAVSSQTELIGAQAADMEAQELELAIGEPTGLEAIDNGQLTNDNAPIYNVAGQRLSKMQRGINITNGRKVLK